MPMTTEALIAAVDPVMAVERALNVAERDAFTRVALVGAFDGATPADWIVHAQEADACLDNVETWWKHRGDDTVAYLAAQHQLPDTLIHALLDAALYATCAITAVSLGERRRDHVEIASAAAMWVRGYAEAAADPPARLP